MIKKIFWPGPDFGTRDRYNLRKLLLKGDDIETLDVGFGNGCMTFFAAQNGKRALGVSILQHEVDKATSLRSLFKLENNQCQFEKIHFNEVSSTGHGPFDQIVMFEVLEHIADDNQAIATAYKLLKSRGQLHITVPNMDHHGHFETLTRFENGGHVRHGYTQDRLQELLQQNGFEILDRRGVGGEGSILGFKIVALLRRAPGPIGQILSLLGFIMLSPFVCLLNSLFPGPWSHYILACKK
jgi:2-polyprenyl-3-methyl-5-hydroxy-6-metoxy-1,4-benzoquinol methylase